MSHGRLLVSGGGCPRRAALLAALAVILGMLLGPVASSQAASTAPTITSANQATFTTGLPGSFTVISTGVPIASLSESGSLPAGVTFTNNGDGTATLAGTPASAGSYLITITASNGVLPDATQSFTLTVDQAPAITSADNTAFNAGVPRSFTVTWTGVPNAKLSESGSLPGGITFTDKGNGTATLSGKAAAAAAGSYPITITASNGISPVATQKFTLKVQATSASILSPANGGLYTLGQIVTVSFSCQMDGSGFKSCVDSGDTDRLDTSSLGMHTFTVTATSLDGQSGSASVHYTVIAPAVRLSNLRIWPTKFTAARHGASIIASGKQGARVSYRDSVAARTKFRVYRMNAGVRRLVGSFTHSDTVGQNHFRFSGRVGGRALRAGSYRLKAIARLDGSASQARTVSFTIRR